MVHELLFRLMWISLIVKKVMAMCLSVSIKEKSHTHTHQTHDLMDIIP